MAPKRATLSEAMAPRRATFQERGGECLGTKELHPIGKLEIGVDDQGDMVVQRGAKLEEQLSAAPPQRGVPSRKRDEAEFVENDEVLFAGVGESGPLRAMALS